MVPEWTCVPRPWEPWRPVSATRWSLTTPSRLLQGGSASLETFQILATPFPFSPHRDPAAQARPFFGLRQVDRQKAGSRGRGGMGGGWRALIVATCSGQTPLPLSLPAGMLTHQHRSLFSVDEVTENPFERDHRGPQSDSIPLLRNPTFPQVRYRQGLLSVHPCEVVV